MNVNGKYNVNLDRNAHGTMYGPRDSYIESRGCILMKDVTVPSGIALGTKFRIMKSSLDVDGNTHRIVEKMKGVLIGEYPKYFLFKLKNYTLTISKVDILTGRYKLSMA